MYLHREGYKIILFSLGLYLICVFLSLHFLRAILPYLALIVFLVLSVVLFLIIWFFRIPKRVYTTGENKIIAPADGVIVVSEKAFDAEYFQEQRYQVSIFMSPLNVHVNRYPLDGRVVYSKYHKGKFMLASVPKSSTANERHSIVLETSSRVQILVKQIAGTLARRIVNYAYEGLSVKQNEELGFIKFGSRVDLLLPLDTKLSVKIGDKVKGGVTVIGEL